MNHLHFKTTSKGRGIMVILVDVLTMRVIYWIFVGILTVTVNLRLAVLSDFLLHAVIIKV